MWRDLRRYRLRGQRRHDDQDRLASRVVRPQWPAESRAISTLGGLAGEAVGLKEEAGVTLGIGTLGSCAYGPLCPLGSLGLGGDSRESPQPLSSC